MTPFLRKTLGMNWMLILFMFGLLIFGVFMIESAARHLPVSAEALAQYGSAGASYAAKERCCLTHHKYFPMSGRRRARATL
ncbi:MAG: hypothetical protein K9N23_03600 [Akkermansiaceae bacterium]|nr:hypothetical protein [Akkermansiaceae bacterium]